MADVPDRAENVRRHEDLVEGVRALRRADPDVIAALPSSLVAALPLAFAAGLVSFVSPCVLPLLPGYLAFLSGATGRSRGPPRAEGARSSGSLAFVFGFAVVFVSLGALFGGLGSTLQAHQRPLEIVFGVVTVALGLFFAGWWPSAWLASANGACTTCRGRRSSARRRWASRSPSAGPRASDRPSAAILGLAASTSGATALRGSILAFVYCLGLGLPFVVAALATEWMASASAWLRRHARVIGRDRGRPAHRDRRGRGDRARGTPSCCGSRSTCPPAPPRSVSTRTRRLSR